MGIADVVPDRVVASCLFDSVGWMRQWATAPIEQCLQRRYALDGDGSGSYDVLPVYLVRHSPFWFGYERQSGVDPLCQGSIAFAGSTHSMYSKRGPVSPKLIRDAYGQARDWYDAGQADILVVPNITSAGVDDWIAEVGQPDAQLVLDRTYYIEHSDNFTAYLHRLDRKVRRDIERRLRRSAERGVRFRLLPADQAASFIKAALPLTIGTTDEHSWPPLYDEATLHCLLRVPGAVLAVAEVGDRLIGVFFGFVHGEEVTFLCGGVDYSTLPEYSTYVVLMYGCVQWACDTGLRRVEWGRDNYRFKERHGLVGVDLCALVYDFAEDAGRRGKLARMRTELIAYIVGDPG
jgi:CelD/BcsL family acetyltransferase involved in cellulose biosynthesis